MQKPDIVEKRGVTPTLRLSDPWAMVFLGSWVLLMSTANTYSFGVFFKPIAAEFSWSREAISAAIALRALTAAAILAPLGFWVDLYGPRRVLLPSFILTGVGLILSAKITSLYQLYLVQGLLLGIAAPGVYIAVMSTISGLHDKKRGLALGIASAGNGLGSVLFPPLAAWIMQATDWHVTTAILGLLVITIAVPSCLLIKTTKVAQVGQLNGRNNRGGPLDAWRALPDLLKNREFVALAAMFFFFYFACQLAVNHLVNFATDTGLDPLTAATMLSVMGFAGFAGRLVMGAVSDRIGTKADSLTCFSLVFAALLLWTLKVPWIMWFAAVLFGVGFGGAAPLIPSIISEHFGMASLGTMIGAVFAVSNIGAAAGPYMGGLMFDLTNTYLWAFLLSAAFVAVAFAVAVRMPKATPESKASVQATLDRKPSSG